MADTMNNLPGAVSTASALAEVGGEDFVIAITAAYMAGLAVGFFKSRDEIAQNMAIQRTFTPQLDAGSREKRYQKWLRAVERSRDWEE